MSKTVARTENSLAERIAAQQGRQQRRTQPASTPNPGDAAGTMGPRRRSWTASTQRWMRWFHAYASMIAFLVILFFGVTGLLLNHPQWLYGDEFVTTNLEGTLPDSVIADDGTLEFLAVSEFFRSELGVVGEVTNFDQLGAEGSINYTGPAYGASARFDVEDLSYSVTVREEGFVNAMRDLHTGSDSGSAWSLAIDVSAVFLVVVSLSGLGIQLLMKKRRTRALAWLAGGTVATIALIWIAMA